MSHSQNRVRVGRTILGALVLGLFTFIGDGAQAGIAIIEFAPPGAGQPNHLFVPAQTTVDQMSPGMANAYVRGIQEELAIHGYRPGGVDGLAGARTVRAIRAYQRDAGLPVNGLATKELLDHLKFSLPKVYANPSRSGASRALITEVQQQLSARGYYQSSIDGVVGPATREAARRFQNDAGLTINGAIDRRLLSQLKLADRGVRAY